MERLCVRHTFYKAGCYASDSSCDVSQKLLAYILSFLTRLFFPTKSSFTLTWRLGSIVTTAYDTPHFPLSASIGVGDILLSFLMRFEVFPSNPRLAGYPQGTSSCTGEEHR